MAIFHPAEFYYEKIYIHNNIWKFCDDHILIKFFFGCIIDIQKNFEKKQRQPSSLKENEKQMNTFLGSF